MTIIRIKNKLFIITPEAEQQYIKDGIDVEIPTLINLGYREDEDDKVFEIID